MLRIAAAAALLAIPLPLAAQADAQRFPTWLAGAWSHADGEGWTEEFWTHPRGGIMIGASRQGRGER